MRVDPTVFVYTGVSVGVIGLIVYGEAHLIGLNPETIEASRV